MDSWKQVEDILKTKTFHTTKCKAYPYEKLNTSKGVLKSRELALATAEETSAALGNGEWQTWEESPLEKTKNKSRPTPTSWHLTSTILPRRWRLTIILKVLKICPVTPEVLQMPKIWTPQGCLQRMTDMCPVQWKGPRPHGRLLLKRNLMFKLPTRSSTLLKIMGYLWKRKGNSCGETQEECVLGSKKIVGTYMRKNNYASVAWRADTINEENKYIVLMEKLIPLEPNNWSKFQEHLKKLPSTKFHQTQTQQQVNKEKWVGPKSKATTHIESTTPTQNLEQNSSYISLQSVYQNHQRKTKKLISPKAGTTQTKTTSSHWPSWQNAYEHQCEQWKCMLTALN